MPPSLQGARAPGLQTIVYGGGPMYRADLDHAHQAFGHRLAQIYGQGESPMTITALSKLHHADTRHPRLPRATRLGRVCPHSVVRVSDPLGGWARSRPGEIGDVCVRGDVVMSGYWGNPERGSRGVARRLALDRRPGAARRGRLPALKDRSKDLIVSGGSNIYPREVEEVLLLHPGVAGGERGGQSRPRVGRGGRWLHRRRAARRPRRESLDALCLEHIARFKRPREYRFVDRLPKNNYGKVVKTECARSSAPRARPNYDSPWRSSPASTAASSFLDGIDIHAAIGPKRVGPAVLLLHGYPQTHAIWHKVAPRLAERYNVVATDLRGYGDSGKPATAPDHAPYSKRVMAKDQVDLMRALGHERFLLVGHDRGGRVAHRLAMDHPKAVRKVVVLDIAPTLADVRADHRTHSRAPTGTGSSSSSAPRAGADDRARREDLPAREDVGEPGARRVRARRRGRKYERCFTPGRHPRELRGLPRRGYDRSRARPRDRDGRAQGTCAAIGAVGRERRGRALASGPLDEWRRVADDVRGRALPGGALSSEEVPDLLTTELEKFFGE
jgi:pimeloyl-ACP methyl ester carboxylesterase